MRNYIKKLIVIGTIIASSFFIADKARGLEDIVNKTKTEQKVDSTKVENIKKERKINNYNINAGGMDDGISNSGYFKSGLTLVKKIEIEFVYDRVRADKDVREILKKEAKDKERELLIFSCQYNLNKYGTIGLLYDSDGVIGLYSTLFKGGFKKTFSNGLANGLDIAGFMGVKVGKVNFSKEKEDVLGATMIYKMPGQYTNNIIGFLLKGDFHIPRKYIKNNMLEGPWVGQATAKMDVPITKKVRFGVEYNLRKDYIPVADFSFIRKGINFNISVSNDEKAKK